MALTTKVLEIRDRNTFIAVMATRMSTGIPPVDWYLRKCGYVPDSNSIMLVRLDGSGPIANHSSDWHDRTFHVAHEFIERHWHELNDGSVVDVEHILGESKERKISERFIDEYNPQVDDRGPARKPGRAKRSRTKA